MSKNEHLIENGVNFHKLIKGLSTNALKYLINIARQETNRRRSKRIFPEFENKDLPQKISFDQYTKLLIRNEYYTIDSYDIGNNIQQRVTSAVEIDIQHWKELAQQDTPISITIKNKTNSEYKRIELHSRSKVFWLINLIIQSDEDIDLNVERYNLPETASDIHF